MKPLIVTKNQELKLTSSVNKQFTKEIEKEETTGHDNNFFF